MAIPWTSISFGISGGLDSKEAPLSVPPGSFLQLDNLVQERKNEWRIRNGFVLDAATTSPPVLAAKREAGGYITVGSDTFSWYIPSIQNTGNASGRALGSLSNRKIGISDGSAYSCAYASDGTVEASISTDAATALQTYMALDSADSTVVSRSNPGTATDSARCALTNVGGVKYLSYFFVDGAGALIVTTINANTTFVTAYLSTIRSGLTATGKMDARCFPGSTTVTIVCQMAAGNIRYIEYDPVTNTTPVDVAYVGVASGALSLLFSPTSSAANRWVAHSDGANTIVNVITAATGAVAVTKTLEVVSSTKITGVVPSAASSTSDFVAVWQTAAGSVRRGGTVASVVQTPTTPFVATTNGYTQTIVSQAWCAQDQTKWFFVAGQHSSSTADPQHTYVLCSDSTDASVGLVGFDLISPIAPLQGHDVANLFQISQIATYTFEFPLNILSNYIAAPTTNKYNYTKTVFRHQLMVTSDFANGVNIGRPTPDGVFYPMSAGALRTFDGVNLFPACGTFAIPPQFTLAQGAGGALTLLGVYQYCYVTEYLYADGRFWRSPPSVPVSITLTGANNAVSFTFPLFRQPRNDVSALRTKIFRTQNNGSTFRLVMVTSVAGSGGASDLVSDTALANAEILYATGESANVVTPPANHSFYFDDRLWIVDRDFPTELWYSKNLRPGRIPEFAAPNGLDLDDQFGDITGAASVEGRGVIFKKNAIYFLQGEGLTDAGSGTNYTATRISDDIGAIPGSPIVSVGDAIFFVAERGIHSVDAGGRIVFVGAGIDAWFNQPQANTAEYVHDGCFVPLRNEVRFVTTNYVFVYDRNFPDPTTGMGHWSRWTGSLMSGNKRCIVTGGQFCLFKANGQVYRESSTVWTDNGTAITGTIRTPWIRFTPTGNLITTPAQAPLRLKSSRVVYTRPSAGTSASVATTVYRSDDDSLSETFASGALAGGVLSDVGEMFPVNQKCSSFSLKAVITNDDGKFRIEGFTANVGIRNPSEQRRPDGGKWA